MINVRITVAVFTAILICAFVPILVDGVIWIFRHWHPIKHNHNATGLVISVPIHPHKDSSANVDVHIWRHKENNSWVVTRDGRAHWKTEPSYWRVGFTFGRLNLDRLHKRFEFCDYYKTDEGG